MRLAYHFFLAKNIEIYLKIYGQIKFTSTNFVVNSSLLFSYLIIRGFISKSIDNEMSYSEVWVVLVFLTWDSQHVSSRLYRVHQSWLDLNFILLNVMPIFTLRVFDIMFDNTRFHLNQLTIRELTHLFLSRLRFSTSEYFIQGKNKHSGTSCFKWFIRSLNLMCYTIYVDMFCLRRFS